MELEALKKDYNVITEFQRRAFWEAIISEAKVLNEHGINRKFVPGYFIGDGTNQGLFLEIQQEARRIRDAGGGGIKFACEVTDHGSRKSERLTPRARSYPFMLDEKRGWVK